MRLSRKQAQDNIIIILSTNCYFGHLHKKVSQLNELGMVHIFQPFSKNTKSMLGRGGGITYLYTLKNVKYFNGELETLENAYVYLSRQLIQISVHKASVNLHQRKYLRNVFNTSIVSPNVAYIHS